MIEFDTLMKKCLDLAIKGKLVPQDPNDEPASELLKKIKAEKEQLIKDKKIKKDKNESTIFRGKDGLFYETIGNETKCIQEEIPFEIPDSWEWCRLKNICREFLVPQRDKPKVFDGNIPWCRIDDIEGMFLSRTHSNLYVSEDTVKSMNLKVYPIGTVITANSASIGVSAITTVECITNQTFIGIVCNELSLFNKYLYYFFCSQLKNLKTIGKGTTISYISREKYENYLFPLPPLSEQKRIVEKLEEIKKNVELGKNAYTEISKEITPRIKKKILDLAIKGQLVPQDPNDEPASELLKKIKAEKEQLIKDKKIKKDKNESTIFRGKDGLFYETIGNDTKCIQEEIPFEIPDSWEWCRLKDLFNVRSALRIHQTDWQKEGIPFFRGRDLVELCKTGKVTPEVFISKELYEQNKQKSGVPQKNDLLVSAVGSLGYVYVVKGGIDFYYKDAYILCFENLIGFEPKYIKFFIEADYIQKFIRSTSNGTTVEQLTIETAKNLLVSLPPLSEQKRIVDKLEEITSQIDLFDK